MKAPETTLRFKTTGGGFVGGAANPIDCLISTARGNAASWTTMIGLAPIGDWELALPNTDAVKDQFNQKIGDMLLVITYSGHTPEWPA